VNRRVRKSVGRKRVIAAAVVSLAILAMLAWKTGVRLEAVGSSFRAVNWQVLAATCAFSAAWHIFLGADKWWRIMRAQGANLGFWEVCRVRLGSDPIRFTLPLKSGELVNAFYFGRNEALGFSRAAGSIAFDKCLNLFGTIFWLYVGIVAMAKAPAVSQLALHTAVGAAVLVLLWVGPVRRLGAGIAAAIHPRLGRLATGVLSGFEEFSTLQKLGFLLYGIVFQIRPLVVVALLFHAFHPAQIPSTVQFLAFGSIVVLMSNVPLTVAGIGPREAALTLLFADFADPAVRMSIGLMMSFTIHIIPMILGVPLMFPLIRSLALQNVVTEEAAAKVDSVAPIPAEEPDLSVSPLGGRR